MMDFHILIIIACVFLASFGSLLFINKFFRRKTFEELLAEKKAMSDKIYGQNKAAAKKPKKLQQLKKETKREKKQRQKEQQKDNAEEQHEDSDAQSEQPAIEDEQPGLSKTHVEFEPDPEVMTYNAQTNRRISISEKENIVTQQQIPKSKKGKRAAKAGILVNKNEPVAVKENLNVVEQLNSFDVKPPKDIVELKKHEKEKEKKEERVQNQPPNKKEKKKQQQQSLPQQQPTAQQQPQQQQPAEVEPAVAVVEIAPAAKEVKPQEEKITRQVSPKNHQNSNKTKQQNKKQNKETGAATTKELIQALDKLSDNDTIGVSLLMNLFRRADLNRSEIQILIDYLLNKQQDMPSSHSEWSDDICTKLKRQLEEKERALAEQQEASNGIQAKLRELRAEINGERSQMSSTIKMYVDKLHAKDQEIIGLNQELQSVNEKLSLERQQFQAQLLREKQTAQGSQDLLSQLQLMQSELTVKEQCIAELTCLVNNSRHSADESAQKNEIIQNQSQQICALEQQRDELEQISNNRLFELEQAKVLETENAECKVEIRNLQNAMESAKADLKQALTDLSLLRTELLNAHNAELSEKQKEIQTLQAVNFELSQQLAGISSHTAEQLKEHSGLQATLEALQMQLAEKDRHLGDLNVKLAELLQQIASVEANAQQQVQQKQLLQETLEAQKADVAKKQKQLQEAEQTVEKFGSREKELLLQLHEQKEKNNQQEQILQAAQQKSSAVTTDPGKDQEKIRELFQRLYPDAVNACAATALSASFDQWIEQVLATHIKQSISKSNATSTSNSNKSTQSNSSDSSGSNSHINSSTHNNNSHNNNLLSSETTNNSNSKLNSTSSVGDNSSSDTAEMEALHTQNAQLRAKIDELTKLVTKTSNTLSELESRAREQDEYHRRVVSSKDELIHTLQRQHSNGEQNI